MTELVLNPDTALARMRVVVTGAAGGDLERLDPDGTWHAVRGGSALTGDALIDDYELPLGVEVTYRLDGIEALGTLTGVDTPWLSHPTRPDLNRPVTLVDDDEWQWSAPGTVHELVDSEYPVAVWTRRTEHTGRIELSSTWTERGAVRALLADGSPLLLRVPPGCYADDAWIWAESVTRRKSRRYEPSSVRWELAYQRVDEPGGIITLDPTNSWGAVLATHPTWLDVAADHADWVDVALTPHPHA